jgi:hypothetical protein
MVNASAELELRLIARDEMSKVFKDAKKEAGGFGDTLSSVSKIAGGFIAANVISGGMEKLTGFISDSVAGYQAHKENLAQLDAVLKSTGATAWTSKQTLADYADQLELVTKFDGDVIQSGEAMLLTFTNIKNSVDGSSQVFDDATMTLLDMAQALGSDVPTQAIQLGKALNDPITGLTALTRVGVTFTEEQKEQIKVMQEAGDIAGAQNVILAELNKEFGGSAKAASDAAGANEVYKDKMAALQDEIGAKLLPVQMKWKELQAEAIGFILEVAIPALEKFIEKHPEIMQAISDVSDFVAEHWPEIQAVIAFAMEQIVAKIEGAIQVAQGIISVVSDVVEGVDALIHGRWSEAWDAFKKIPGDILVILTGLLQEQLGTLPQLLWDAGVDAMQGLIDGFESKIGDVEDWIDDKLGGIPGKITGLFKSNSPSKVFFDIGDDVVQGLINGLKSKEGDLEGMFAALVKIGNDKGDSLIDTIRKKFSIAEDAAGDVARRLAGLNVKPNGALTNAQADKYATQLTKKYGAGNELLNLVPNNTGIISRQTFNSPQDLIRLKYGVNEDEAGRMYRSGVRAVTVNVSGSVVSENDLTAIVRDAVNNGGYRGVPF